MNDTTRPKRGRPRKPPEATLDEFMPCRTTAADRSRIEANAARAGLSVSEFMRRAALGQRVRAKRSDPADRLIVELNRIGTNLNQITAKLHMTGELPASVEVTMAELQGVLAKVADDDA